MLLLLTMQLLLTPDLIFRMASSLFPASVLLLLLLLLLGTLLPPARPLSNDILGFDLPEEPKLDANTVCKNYPDLTQYQYKLCSKYPDVAASAIQGLQVAIHECLQQFRQYRWNCSSLENHKNPYSSPILTKGYKETAFVYALASAGMSYQVSRACSMGKLPDCGCSRHFDDHAQTWIWSGCSQNMEFGEWFTRRFLDRKERAQDLHSQINLHNNRAGRLVLRHMGRVVCKCHGMSGSCETRTCWKTPSQFTLIGSALKDKYWVATKVKVGNTNSAKGYLQSISSLRKHTRLKKKQKKRRHHRSVRKTDLVYFERSSSFCERDARLDIAGTNGRYCNRTSADIDNCETLCCGRGYNTMKTTRSERCHCKFHWCCYVVCQNCSVTEWLTVCK